MCFIIFYLTSFTLAVDDHQSVILHCRYSSSIGYYTSNVLSIGLAIMNAYLNINSLLTYFKI